MTRHFTIEEANRLLPRLKVLVSALVATHEQIVAARQDVSSVLDKSTSNSGSARASQLVMVFQRFDTLLRRINDLGVEVKAVDTGLCDFPALHQGRDIYLCWRLGEERVEWWHELHTGYAGRRHVTDLS